MPGRIVTPAPPSAPPPGAANTTASARAPRRSSSATSAPAPRPTRRTFPLGPPPIGNVRPAARDLHRLGSQASRPPSNRSSPSRNASYAHRTVATSRPFMRGAVRTMASSSTRTASRASVSRRRRRRRSRTRASPAQFAASFADILSAVSQAVSHSARTVAAGASGTSARVLILAHAAKARPPRRGSGFEFRSGFVVSFRRSQPSLNR